ncbi:pilus assembly protein CpaF, partial [gut metagenome]
MEENIERNREDFLNLRKQLVEYLENTWEETDEEVMESIDHLILEYCKKNYLSIARREILRVELFQSVRKMDVLEELLED